MSASVFTALATTHAAIMQQTNPRTARRAGQQAGERRSIAQGTQGRQHGSHNAITTPPPSRSVREHVRDNDTSHWCFRVVLKLSHPILRESTSCVRRRTRAVPRTSPAFITLPPSTLHLTLPSVMTRPRVSRDAFSRVTCHVQPLSGNVIVSRC